MVIRLQSVSLGKKLGAPNRVWCYKDSCLIFSSQVKSRFLSNYISEITDWDFFKGQRLQQQDFKKAPKDDGAVKHKDN